MSPSYAERPVQFGSDRHLFGMLCLPSAPGPEKAPMVVMLNSGLVHRAGVNRIHVLLARSLAERGIGSLRFDLSGIGDSERRIEADSLDEAVRRDVDEALEFVAGFRDVESFVLLGLCSGAYDSLVFAERDPRVAGVVAIDVFGSFHTLRHVLVHYAGRVPDGSAWRVALSRPFSVLRALFRRLRGWRHVGSGTPERADGSQGVRPTLLRGELDAILGSLRERDGRALFVFTGGLEDNYNYEHQFRDRYPEHVKSGKVDYRFFPESDHTFTRHRARERLVRTVSGWIAATWSGREGASSADPVRGPGSASAVG